MCFELAEYEGVLEKIASTDVVEDISWEKLRTIIKTKLDQNISLILSQSNDALSTVPLFTSPRALPSGGLRLPPFQSRPRDENNPNEAPKSILTATEAEEFKEVLYGELDEFEGVPFTIQRLCELCLYPQKHYKKIGKYLRAVEKTLLVTSTWDAFPALPPATSQITTVTTNFDSILLSSAPPTPMFSPIPFLHDDARRSKSRSPPPSPLVLPARATAATNTAIPLTSAENVEPPALGLVDELDDPSPGHLSDHPQPLSATTTVINPKTVASLAERFVRSTEDARASQGEKSTDSSSTEKVEEMMVDDPEKENKAD